MSSSKLKPRRLFSAVAQECGLTGEQVSALLAALDAAGMVVMPVQPTGALLDVSLKAMRSSRHLVPVDLPKDAAQRMKHEIRYRAMVERQREGLGLVDKAVSDSVAAERAIALVKQR